MQNFSGAVGFRGRGSRCDRHSFCELNHRVRIIRIGNLHSNGIGSSFCENQPVCSIPLGRNRGVIGIGAHKVRHKVKAVSSVAGAHAGIYLGIAGIRHLMISIGERLPGLPNIKRVGSCRMELRYLHIFGVRENPISVTIYRVVSISGGGWFCSDVCDITECICDGDDGGRGAIQSPDRGDITDRLLGGHFKMYFAVAGFQRGAQAMIMLRVSCVGGFSG